MTKATYRETPRLRHAVQGLCGDGVSAADIIARLNAGFDVVACRELYRIEIGADEDETHVYRVGIVFMDSEAVEVIEAHGEYTTGEAYVDTYERRAYNHMRRQMHERIAVRRATGRRLA